MYYTYSNTYNNNNIYYSSSSSSSSSSYRRKIQSFLHFQSFRACYILYVSSPYYTTSGFLAFSQNQQSESCGLFHGSCIFVDQRLSSSRSLGGRERACARVCKAKGFALNSQKKIRRRENKGKKPSMSNISSLLLKSIRRLL